MPRVARPRDLLVRRLLVDDRLTGRKHATVERLEQRRKLGDHLGERAANVLLRRPPVQLRERIVHPDEAELAVPETDPDGSGDEESVELGV